ncbi:hypothetical protein V5E97_14460 [Singulisphaera sp. Ch08]|uniref:Uncharacterized protein n=1 Tax=Singulisphaera sp. Ch08 TaxID=3120278 RepID=A0AAU7CQC6_9BACT
MTQFIWVGILPACLVALFLILRRPARQFAEEMHVDHARDLFRQQREWLEARFLTALGKVDPIEGLRWEEAHWHDEVLWARDRQTRRLLALIGVHFDSSPFEDLPDPAPRHATALFEFRKGRWFAEGKRLDEVGPDEAVRRNQRFEPVVLHPRRGF